jgi:hypothetical protein
MEFVEQQPRPGVLVLANKGEAYSLSEYLPSCSVTRELLSDLEKYILTKCQRSREGASVEPTPRQFTVKDSHGSEYLATVDDFMFHDFPDDTREIELSCGHHDATTIRMRFGQSRTLSLVIIECKGADAKERAWGILEGILKRVSTQKTYHDLFSLLSVFRQTI